MNLNNLDPSWFIDNIYLSVQSSILFRKQFVIARCYFVPFRYELFYQTLSKRFILDV